MKNLYLITAAAVVLALGGSVSKADFVITHSRTANAFTLNSQSYDIVTFSVVNNGINGTGSTFISVDAALYTPSPGGMLIGVGTGSNTTHADVFGTNTSSSPHTSWIADNTPPFSVNGTLGGVILPLGLDPIPSHNQGVKPDSQTFTANQTVQGIAGTLYTTGTPQPAGSGVIFAQAVVQHSATVTLLNPVSSWLVRGFEPNSGNFSSGDGKTVGATIPSVSVLSG